MQNRKPHRQKAPQTGHSIFGTILFSLLAVLAVVKRRELLGALTAIPELYAAAAPILLLACMMVSGMVFFTASSVSLEGKSYWIVRSMPVETKKVLQAKLSLSNSLAIAPALLMTLAAALALRLPAAETALLLACQLLFVLLTANVGLMEDLRHCNLDWINETQAAKQGAGVLLSMLLAFGFVVAVGALYFFLLAVLMSATAALGLILALMAILYALTARWLMTRGVKRFETLANEAERLGIKIAIENTEGEEYLERLLSCLNGHPAVGFCIDTGHEMCYNESRDLISKYARQLLCTHLNDNMKITGDEITWLDDSHMMPFDGLADWRADICPDTLMTW